MTAIEIFSIYFPVAEVRLSAIVVIGIGFLSGIMSGLLGVGGGFISTPLLMYFGVSAPVAVATSSHQIIGASFSGILPRLKQKKIDFKLGFVLSISGMIGAYIGAIIFEGFLRHGNIDTIISIFYIVLMSFVTFLSLKSYFAKNTNNIVKSTRSRRFIFCKIKFHTANIECSILTPIILGIITGIIIIIMGVGGGFILVPIMISIMKIENDVAVGTSLLQVFCVTILVVLFHIFETGLLDIMLGILLIIGATIGAQISSVISLRIGKKRIINLLLAILTLTIAVKFMVDLFSSSKEENILIEQIYE